MKVMTNSEIGLLILVILSVGNLYLQMSPSYFLRKSLDYFSRMSEEKKGEYFSNIIASFMTSEEGADLIRTTYNFHKQKISEIEADIYSLKPPYLKLWHGLLFIATPPIYQGMLWMLIAGIRNSLYLDKFLEDPSTHIYKGWFYIPSFSFLLDVWVPVPGREEQQLLPRTFYFV